MLRALDRRSQGHGTDGDEATVQARLGWRGPLSCPRPAKAHPPRALRGLRPLILSRASLRLTGHRTELVLKRLRFWFGRRVARPGGAAGNPCLFYIINAAVRATKLSPRCHGNIAIKGWGHALPCELGL